MSVHEYPDCPGVADDDGPCWCPKKGGNWTFIPIEFRDTQHPEYQCWAGFIEDIAAETMGAGYTRDLWTQYLEGWRTVRPARLSH